MCGLQTQHAPSGYVGMWSRAAAFRRADLTAALERADGRAGLGHAQHHPHGRRCGLPAVHRGGPGDPARAVAACGEAGGRAGHAGRRRGRAPVPRGRPAQPAPARRPARGGRVPEGRVGRRAAVDRPAARAARRDVGQAAGAPVRAGGARPGRAPAPPAATREPPIRSSTPPATCSSPLPAGVRARLPGDVASFTGLSIAEVRAVLDRCELRNFVTEAGGTLVDVPDAPLPDAGTPAPVRFLGTWDAMLLVHARRAQVLPEALRPRVFATSMPRSVPTFLVDGQVAGTWSYDGGQVVTDAVPRPAHRRAPRPRAEAERLAAFHAAPARHVRAGGRLWWRRRERAARRSGVRRRSRTARGVRPGDRAARPA